jgi:5-methylcytosine-specific restriction enzyme subunit McrC
MMAYAHVYECKRLILLYPHHFELAEEEGMLAVHQIANKTDSLIGIATVGLVEPRKVRLFLQILLLSKGTAFDLSDDQTLPALAVPA